MNNLSVNLTEIVRSTVDEVNAELDLNDTTKIDKNTATVLYGSGATIDSMTLVSLIVAVEENIRRELGLSITLANEKAMSMKRSPFSTLDTLIDYLGVVVREAQNS